jgi:hypothetical protein
MDCAQEINVREKNFRQQLRSGNTSQLGDWENIRNVTLNGNAMKYCTVVRQFHIIMTRFMQFHSFLATP